MEKVILFAILLFGAAHSLDFEHCDENEGAEPVDFYIYRCFDSPCTFTRNNKTTGNVKFMAAEEINRIDMEVHVIHGDSQVTIAGEGVHKCSGFREGECKYEAGTKVNYFFLFPVVIESNEEEVLQFKMTLKNENGTPLTCAKFNAKIRDGAAPEVHVPEGSE